MAKTPFGWRVEQKLRYYKETFSTRQKIIFGLTDEEARAILVGNCHFCGDRARLPIPHVISRLDLTLGFEKNNCVTACFWCNAMKAGLCEQEFLLRCKQIVAHASHLLNT